MRRQSRLPTTQAFSGRWRPVGVTHEQGGDKTGTRICSHCANTGQPGRFQQKECISQTPINNHVPRKNKGSKCFLKNCLVTPNKGVRACSTNEDQLQSQTANTEIFALPSRSCVTLGMLLVCLSSPICKVGTVIASHSLAVVRCKRLNP